MPPSPLLAAIVLFPFFAPLPVPSPTPAPPRPRDPWVFRSVLDKHPRILTIALHEDLWLAYDTATCSLFAAWRGDVALDGAVYTTVHGPQPTHRGVDVGDPLTGGTWKLAVGERDEPLTPVWRGYHFSDGHVTLDFELRTAHGKTITVAETPELTPLTDVLERRFRVDGLPDGAILALDGAATPRDACEVLEGSDAKLTTAMGSFAPDATGCIRMMLPHRLELTNGEHRLRVHHGPSRPPANRGSR